MKLKITYESGDGFSYSEIYEPDDWEIEEKRYTIGIWNRPFPNTMEESTAFGLEECLMHSDDCPGHFFEHPITRIIVQYAEVYKFE